MARERKGGRQTERESKIRALPSSDKQVEPGVLREREGEGGARGGVKDIKEKRYS